MMPRPWIKSPLALLLCFCTGAAVAGEFQKAYEAALSNDPTFQAARAELASSRQYLPLAKAGLLPSVAFSASDARVNGERTGPNAAGIPTSSPLDYRAPAQSLNFRMPLFNREAWEKLTLAEAQVGYAGAVFATRQADLLDRLATAYLQRLLAESAAAAAEAQVLALQAQSDQARRQLQLGEGTRPEALEAEAAVFLARVQLIEAQDQINITALSLRQITGRDPQNPTATTAALKPETLFKRLPAVKESMTDLLARAQAGSPGVAAKRYAVLVAEAGVARSRAGHYPRLDLVASASSSRNETISTLNQSVNQRTLGVQFNLPIYSGGAVNAGVAQALADKDKAEADLAVEQQTLVRDVTRLILAVGLIVLLCVAASLPEPPPGIAVGRTAPVSGSELWDLNPR